MTEPKVRVSASKLKTADTCTWLYWVNYHTNFPKSSNSGANRGSVSHYVLECLLRDDRRDHVDVILKNGHIKFCKSVDRLAKHHAKKLAVCDPENYAMINDFILVALKNDFYCKGATKVIAEHEFDIEGRNYMIKGFIDKIAVYEDRVHVRDYKTSKAKFTAQELEMNFQNIIYRLAAKQMFPGKPISLTFEFLKYKKAPNQEGPHVTDNQLQGFQDYLESVADFLKGMDETRAKSSLARNSLDKRWLCGKQCGDLNAAGQPAFICGAKYPRVYFVLKDATGKFVKSSFDKKELDKLSKEGYSISQESYGGCPGWKYLWS